MNIGSESDGHVDVIYVSFNQISNGICVGTTKGYKLYKLDQQGKFQLEFEQDLNEEVRLIERHYLSSLITFVQTSSPRKTFFFNFKTGHEIAVKHFANSVLAMRLNRTVLVVAIEDSFHLFNMLTMVLIRAIGKVVNPHGVLALTYHGEEESLLAYPGGALAGDIVIYDVPKSAMKRTIPAHTNPIACLTFNDDNTKIASASKRGTVIRIFSVTDGAKLFEFRRGRREVSIYSLQFCSKSLYLSASSNTETIHVFKCVKEEDETDSVKSDIVEENEGWIATVTKVVSYSAKYLPSQISDVFCQERSFSAIHMPFSGVKNVCCVQRIGRTFNVFVLTIEGMLYTYLLNEEDGICTLVRQHRLDQKEQDVPDAEVPSPDVDVPFPRPTPAAYSANSLPAAYSNSPLHAYPGNTSNNVATGRVARREVCDSDGEASDSCPPLSFSVT